MTYVIWSTQLPFQRRALMLTQMSLLHPPPEHRRLWIEDPEGYRARFLVKDPQLPDIVGLPGYLFPWDLFLDSENAEGAIKSIFIARFS
ncbi:hypothetical protein AYX14_05279 [Cryptococcus neoformans]|nr:hypothetical protein AYX15_05369 [Cryptococcus neoformans var. grubii]OWZ69328.1 hypothetical protein AYX14_05279 [Cryptococcus neoformans var. grubii]OWZ75898.1 hypothetical protein C365_05665 [Cryptococcus neoformans var. grubii Bt85]OXM76587.1 hypothetical protein C364_05665 [Cryptococcus neoformans var. grubii Bt63]